MQFCTTAEQRQALGGAEVWEETSIARCPKSCDLQRNISNIDNCLTTLSDMVFCIFEEIQKIEINLCKYLHSLLGIHPLKALLDLVHKTTPEVD